jgi:hypothetical protein
MRKAWWILPIFVVCSVVPRLELVSAAAEELSLAAAINKAGRQRMLTQRIVLSYCQLGLGVMPEVSRQRLEDAIEVFDRQLAALEGFSPTPEVREALKAVERLWEPFRTVAEGPPSPEGAGRLLYWNDDLLHSSNKVVQLLQDISGEPYGRLVNIAGRQRMLSQRAAKFYMLQEWGFDSVTIRDELERARNEFVGALAALREAPENTEAILTELDDVEFQWAWFDNALTLKGDRAFRLIVSDSAETILTKMDEITLMYEHLSR